MTLKNLSKVRATAVLPVLILHITVTKLGRQLLEIVEGQTDKFAKPRRSMCDASVGERLYKTHLRKKLER